MARILGDFNFSNNLEIKANKPLDARIVVDSLVDLTTEATWKDGKNIFLYDGIVVSVLENHSLYMLKGFHPVDTPQAFANAANWIRIDAAAAQITPVANLTSDSDTEALAASQGKVLDEKITALRTELSAALKYKGSVDTFDELPTEDLNPGDVYNVVAATGDTPAGTNYAWNGESWDALGGDVDLSGYYTKTEVDEAIEAAKPVDELAALVADVSTNKTAIAVINGEATTEGSIKAAVKTAEDYTDTQLEAYVKKEEQTSVDGVTGAVTFAEATEAGNLGVDLVIDTETKVVSATLVGQENLLKVVTVEEASKTGVVALDITEKENSAQELKITVTTVDVSTATEENDGLAKALDVKTYVDDKVDGTVTLVAEHTEQIGNLTTTIADVSTNLNTTNTTVADVSTNLATANGKIDDVSTGLAGVKEQLTWQTLPVDTPEEAPEEA